MKVPATEKRPLILVTNDDGIEAKGVHELAKMIEDLGDIVVVAPDSPRSGQWSALSVGIPLRLNLIEHYRNISFYLTNGTPVDCLKLSMNQLFDCHPELLLSGISCSGRLYNRNPLYRFLSYQSRTGCRFFALPGNRKGKL